MKLLDRPLLNEALNHGLYAVLKPMLDNRLLGYSMRRCLNRWRLDSATGLTFEVSLDVGQGNVVEVHFQRKPVAWHERISVLGHPALLQLAAECIVRFITHGTAQAGRLRDWVNHTGQQLASDGWIIEPDDGSVCPSPGHTWGVLLIPPGTPPYGKMLGYRCKFETNAWPNDGLRLELRVALPGQSHSGRLTKTSSVPAGLREELERRIGVDNEAFSFLQSCEAIEHLRKCYAQHAELILAHQLPWESPLVSCEIVQGLLAAKPVLLARGATNSNRRWMQELTAFCLKRLAAQQPTAQCLVRKLFFALLGAELAEGKARGSQLAKWELLCGELAQRRPLESALPFNPAFPYRRMANSLGDTNSIVDACRVKDIPYQWFLNEASLEDLVHIMGLV